jgi:hypothetical protein
MNLFRFLLIISLNLSYFVVAQTWTHEQLEVKTKNTLNRVMRSDDLFEDRWVELPQAKFWRRIMTLSPDSCLINVAKNRTILETMAFKQWRSKTEIEKAQYKATLRKTFGLDSTEELYVTTGKNDFYRFLTLDENPIDLMC